MGLDWIILARLEEGHETNPIDALGALRADADDPRVIARLRTYWQDTLDAEGRFEDFLAELRKEQPPPIVIPFGEEREQAIPFAAAEVQFYGFRGGLLEPRWNPVSAHARAQGIDMDRLLWSELHSEEDIRSRVQLFERIIADYRSCEPIAAELADRYWQEVWLPSRAGADVMDLLARYEELDEAVYDRMYGLLAFMGAVDWLEFWAGRGFSIVPEA